MTEVIKKQLNSLSNVNLEKLSDNEFIIERKKTIESVEINHYYEIELADYIIHPSSNFTLASNWNRGVVPAHKRMKAMVSQVMGKMIKVDSIGEDESGNDTDQAYTGLWLPMGGIKIVREL